MLLNAKPAYFIVCEVIHLNVTLMYCLLLHATDVIIHLFTAEQRCVRVHGLLESLLGGSSQGCTLIREAQGEWRHAGNNVCLPHAGKSTT